MKFKLFLLLLLVPFLVLAQTGLVENFDNGDLQGWAGSADYTLSNESGALHVNANKRDTWNSFTFSFDPVDISENPYVSLKIKADTDVNLGFSVWDENDAYAYPPDMYQEILTSDYMIEYVFDFSKIEDVDLSTIKMLNFVTNPGGALVYNGKIIIDELKIGDQAAVFPYMGAVQNQATFINSSEITVPFRKLAPFGDNENSLTISATSSNETLIPTPTVNYNSGDDSGTLILTPAADMSGESTITITVSGSEPDVKTVPFTVIIEKNAAPTLNAIDAQLAKAGEALTIMLEGIDDGNPNAEQSITLNATSSNQDILPNPTITFKDGAVSGEMILEPILGQSGLVDITISLKDDGGVVDGGVDTSSVTFSANVYDDVNDAPTIDEISNISILEGEGEQVVEITGLSDGDDDLEQNLSFEAISSNPALIPNPTVNYTQGETSGQLVYSPVAGQTGTATITVTVTDDGGTETNNGNQSVTTQFDIQIRVRPTMGFQDDFEDGVLSASWPSDFEGLGENSHRCSEVDGALRIEVDKTRSGNKWAGLWYNIPQELNLAANPFISITMKTTVPGTPMRIYLWDAYNNYNTGGTVTHSVTENYIEYFFDFTGLNLQSDGTVVDFTRIKALLINFDPGGADPLFVGDFYFEDFRVGEFANVPEATPNVTLNPIPDFVYPENPGTRDIKISGLDDGLGETDNIIFEFNTLGKSLINEITPSPIVNGEATLRLDLADDKTGKTIVRVTAMAEGANSITQSFNVFIEDPTRVDANVNITLGQEFQKIDGFGAFMGSRNNVKNERVMQLAKEMGMSMARFGIISEFEPYNDNSDPYVLNLGAFDKNALSLETMKQLKADSEVEKFILTVWSPAAWMKRNKSLSAEYWATDNKLEPYNYEEYAEFLVAAIKTAQNEAGVDFYAISVQNEPQFNEPYPSCVVLWDEMADIIAVVGKRFEQEGLDTKIFWAEVLPAQNRVREYIQAVKDHPEASKYADIVAIHNYDQDGIHVGGAGAQDWADIYDWAQDGDLKCPTWMTETSGHANNWEGAMTLVGNIYNALNFGNASAWVWWSFNDPKSSEQFGLVIDNEPTSRYFISKNYYKYIRPDAIRVESVSDDEEVLALAFKHEENATVTTILINTDSQPKVVSVAGNNTPTLYKSYTTSENRGFEQGENVTGDGVIILPPSSITTLIGSYDPANVEEIVQTPETFQLYQNYPNPFNPETTIQFQLPKTSAVSIKVYDVMGRQVKTLIDQTYQPGLHNVTWRGTDYNGMRVASGVYFYRIKAGSFINVKKSILLK